MTDENEVVGRARGGVARAEKLTPERKSAIAKTAAEARWMVPPAERPERSRALAVISYSRPGKVPVSLGFDSEAQKIWATQEDMAGIFGVEISTISRHIRNIFNEGELEEKSNLQKTQIANSDKPVRAYSLDVIISVGYRVQF